MKHVFREGEGYIVNQDAGGISLEILPQGGGGFEHPFKVTAKLQGGELQVLIRAGTVNNIVPLISDDPLDKNPAPLLYINTTANTTYNIYVAASSASPPVFTPDILEMASSDTELADTNSIGYLKIASITMVGSSSFTVNQFVYASQVLVRAKPGISDAIWFWSSR